MSLFAQGGVAIGLSIMAAEHLGNVKISDSDEYDLSGFIDD